MYKKAFMNIREIARNGETGNDQKIIEIQEVINQSKRRKITDDDIVEFLGRNEYRSIEKMADALGVSASSIIVRMRRLRKDGKIEKTSKGHAIYKVNDN